MDALKWARLRLAIAVLIFVGWIGWLVYLAILGTPRPPVLSHSQVLVSNLDVIAQIDALDPPKIKIKEILWPHKEAEKPPESPVEVPHLPSCVGWNGPGEYLVPLRTDWHGSYDVQPLPPTPGFEKAPPRIYRATPETLREYRTISKPELDALPHE